MSAYIVDRNTIVYMVKAAEHVDMYWNGVQMKRCQDTQFIDVAQMLWDENIKSVQYRYPDCANSLDNAPGPIGEDFKITYKDASAVYGSFDNWTIISACNEYAYQACEHPGWEQSESCRFVETLKSCAIRRLMPENARRIPEPLPNVITL